MTKNERHPELQQSEDVLPTRSVLLTTAASVLVTASLVFLAYLLLQIRESQLRGTHEFPDKNLPAPRARSHVLAEPFAIPRARPALNARNRQQLNEWGWVDRQRGLVRIPIGEAMDVVLQEGQRR